MGWGRGWLAVFALPLLAVLVTAPATALDVDVGWGLATPPTVVTLDAADITQGEALLRGSLSDLGGATSVAVSFEWGLSAALGRETSPETLTAPGPFQAILGELEPGKAYYYRAKAAGNGTAVGETLTFQTAPSAFAGDLFSQLWLYLVLAAIAAIMGYLLTRRQRVAHRKKGRAPLEEPGEAPGATGGLFAKAGTLFGVAGRARGKAKMAGLGAAIGTEDSAKVPCPHCGTQLEEGAISCFGCGRGIREGADLEERMEIAKKALEANERDRDALFTLGAMQAAAGETSEAIESLNRLTMLDPHYPGLWWVKARVFENLGNKKAAESAMMRAMQDDGGAGVEALITAAGQVEAKRESEGHDLPTRPEIQKARKAELQEWCREFGLSDEGVVAVLRVRLLDHLETEAPLNEVEGEVSIAAGEGEGPPGPGACPHCETTLEPETGNCPGCGRSVLDRGEALEERVARALANLELDENDADALYTLGAYLLWDGKAQEALDTLNRLTLLDPDYPGLWWVKARVFEKLGKKKAAESALARAQQGNKGLLPEP